MRFSKIFGIGLPRTGTTSLCEALNQLSISSKHFPIKVFEEDDYSEVEAFTGLIDTPIPLLYKDLDRRYPNSGFILTTRSIDSWLKSMEWLFTEGRYIWHRKPIYDQYLNTFLGCSSFDRSLLKTKFEEYHKDVFNYFNNRSDLLILNLDEKYGYPEICSFLDVAVLMSDYPRGNTCRKARVLQKIAYGSKNIHPKLEMIFRRVDNYIQKPKS